MAGPPDLTLEVLRKPLAAGFWRVLAEGVLGYAFLLVLWQIVGSALDISSGLSFHTAAIPAIVLQLLAFVWLLVWPAWRLRLLVGQRWWARWSVGFVRTVALGSLLGFGAGWVSIALYLHTVRDLPLFVVPVTFFFVLVRLLVVAGAACERWISAKLRRQLMLSHAAATLLAMTGVGALAAVAGITIGIVATHPDPQLMAKSTADLIRLTAPNPSLRGKQSDIVIRRVIVGVLPLRGEPLLSSIVGRAMVRPLRVLLMDRAGNVARAELVQNRSGTRDGITTTQAGAANIPAALRRRLTQAALAPGYTAGKMSLSPFTRIPTFASAPVKNTRGQVVGAVIVEVQPAGFEAFSVLRAGLALFTVATIALIMATSLPIVGLSFLFSFLAARGLTRRLDEVSSVTTAIASGDLSRRAPVTARNEIGRLAANMNRMAEHLEGAMRELRGARTQAEDALQARQELIAAISHELRTPLAVTRAHLETLLLTRPVIAGRKQEEREDVVPVPTATIQTLQNETERLAALVDDLFSLSRTDAGAMNVECESIDVAVLVDDLVTTMRPLAQRDGMIALSVDASPDLPPALADAGRLQQILANLIRNAVRHTPDGGIIVLSVEREDNWIVVAVADTGEGIPAEHLPHIFERFYRVDQSRTRSSGGTGLGLAIVREFVELMGGRVTVESAVGEGARFQVYLPVAP